MIANYNLRKQILLFFLLIGSSFSFGQTGWSIDQTFNKRVAKTNDFFFRVSKRTDGKFLFCADTDKTKLKLLNADGTISTTFEVATTGNIIALTQATGDKTYVGGDFTNMMNVFAPKIARINADGTRDINFLPDTSTQNVYALQEQTDGKLLVGRDGSIQRLNDDGTLDTTFTTVTTNGIVYSFAILPNGKILAGGLFTTINGATKNRVVLLNANGTVDTSFVVGTGFNSDVHIVRVASDGSFFVGGKFTTYKGITINRIAKLSNTGTLDATFHTSNTGFDNDVWTIEFLNDNKPLLGGLFTTYKGVANNSVIKLNLDGTVDASFDTGIAQSNGIVYKIIVNSTNDVFLSGTFMKYKETYTNQAFLANNDGSVNTSFHLDERFCIPGISNWRLSTGTGISRQAKYPTAIQPDGKILLANVYFENIFYIIIRLNQDGSRDTTFNLDVSSLPPNYLIRDIKDIIVRPNGKIICSATAGRGENIEGLPYLKGLFQLNQDGSLDNSFDTGHIYGTNANQYDYVVLNIGLQSDGKLLVHCNQTYNYKGFQANAGAIRVLTNGNLDLSFQNIQGTFENGTFLGIKELPDNKVLIYTKDQSNSGYGTNPSNPYVSNSRFFAIVKLNSDGTVASRFENLHIWNTTQGSPPISEILVEDTSLIICGKFNRVNNIPQNCIARVDFDGNFINNLSSPITTSIGFDNAQITDIIKHDNKFYFTSYSNLVIPPSPNNQVYNPYVDCDINILRANLDGTLDTTFSMVTLDRSNHAFTTNGYSNYYIDSYVKFSPRNVYMGFNDINKLVVFGHYNSINNQPYIGLSRIIIDENLSTPSNQFIESNIKCYPNPTKDIVNISAKSEAIKQINVYDMFGRLLKSQKGSNENEQINIQDLPNAMYLMEVKTNGGNKTVKIIKN